MRVAARDQNGSMFIMVLLILLILTAVALSLVFVTEIEMQLGGTEKTINQTFYAAESGVHAAVAGIALQNWSGEKLTFVEGPIGGSRQIGTRVLTSRIRAVGAPQLPPMTLANETENEYFTFATALRVTAQRVSWPAIEPAPIYDLGDPREQQVTIQSQQSVDVRFLLSPVRKPSYVGEPYDEQADRGFGTPALPPPPPPPPTP